MNSEEEKVKRVPALGTKAGPRDPDWLNRLAEELEIMIQIVEDNKANNQDWFFLESNDDGTRWKGKCWYVYKMMRYEFAMEFEIPVAYPDAPPEIRIPELDGKTAKMYRGGAICCTDHFKPLWGRNVPKFGIVHALMLGLAPWLAVEVPDLVEKGYLSK